MPGQEFLSAYPAKLLEYALGTGYMILFVWFWRYVMSGRQVERAVERFAGRPAGAIAVANAGWFSVPGDILLHPGHTWARAASRGLVEVGLDDFAAKLLGPVERLELPPPGSSVSQGVPALAASDGGRQVRMVSPVEGQVVEVNPLAADASVWQFEPYGAGWLFKVQPDRLDVDRRQLFAGEAARRWVEQASDSLSARASPQLGAVLQDGGAPVHGIAREISPEHWDEICREYFLSESKGGTP